MQNTANVQWFAKIWQSDKLQIKYDKMNISYLINLQK